MRVKTIVLIALLSLVHTSPEHVNCVLLKVSISVCGGRGLCPLGLDPFFQYLRQNSEYCAPIFGLA